MDVSNVHRTRRLSRVDRVVHTARRRGVWIDGRRALAAAAFLSAVWRRVLRVRGGLDDWLFRFARHGGRGYRIVGWVTVDGDCVRGRVWRVEVDCQSLGCTLHTECARVFLRRGDSGCAPE